jgi:hypothetical protein
MATHFISSSLNETPLYKNLINVSTILPKQPDLIVSNNTTINIVEEFTKSECSYHKIKLPNSNLEYYVTIDNVYALPDTKPFADYKCDNVKPNLNYSFINDWTSLDENTVIFDEKELKYKISLLTPYLSLNDFDQQEYANTYGIRAILDYYNIFYTDQTLEKLKNSYNFCVVEDYDVPYSPKKRIRLLVSIKKKYINALIEQQKIETYLSTDKVVYFDTNKLTETLSYISVMFSKYQKDIYLADAKISRLNLIDESQKLISFFDKLKRFLYENNLSITQSKQERIELLLNSCNTIKSISYKNGGDCFRPKIGLNILLEDLTFNNSRTINFVEKIQEIYNIEFCSYTWDKFVNKYVYPKPKVEISNTQKQETSIDAIVNQYNKLINTYNSFSIKSEITYKQMLFNNASSTAIEKKYNEYKNVFIQDPIPYEEIRKSMLDQFSKNAKSASPKLDTDIPVDQDKFISDNLKKLYNFLTVY